MAGPDGLDEESSVTGSLIISGSSRVVVGSPLSQLKLFGLSLSGFTSCTVFVES